MRAIPSDTPIGKGNTVTPAQITAFLDTIVLTIRQRMDAGENVTIDQDCGYRHPASDPSGILGHELEFVERTITITFTAPWEVANPLIVAEVSADHGISRYPAASTQ